MLNPLFYHSTIVPLRQQILYGSSVGRFYLVNQIINYYGPIPLFIQFTLRFNRFKPVVDCLRIPTPFPTPLPFNGLDFFLLPVKLSGFRLVTIIVFLVFAWTSVHPSSALGLPTTTSNTLWYKNARPDK